MFDIRSAGHSDIEALETLYRDMGYALDPTYFSENLERQQAGDRQVLVALSDDNLCGFCIYNRKPRYKFFAHHNIPEIQDLAVIPECRGQGLGSRMIDFCEDLARQEKFEQMGIGVGITKSFGSAQRLYTKKGYVPDGYGAVYDRDYIQEGQFLAVDSHLSIMMIKNL